MILSFSVDAMRPYIVAGIRQALGMDVGDARVKRQTIRPRGPRAIKMLERAVNAGWTHSYDLHMYWKARAPTQCAFLGKIEGGGYIYPITILHSTVEPPGAPSYPILRIDGPNGWRDGDSMLFWSEGEFNAFSHEVYADGFDTVAAFRDYFVPNVGDRFEGALFKW